MRKRLMAGLAMAVMLTGTGAQAQLAGLLSKSLGLPAAGEAGGAYQAKNEVRTYGTGDPLDAARLYKTVIEKASDMAEAKGFPRIAVTKSRCTTLMIGGSPRSMSCYVIAVMLQAGETAQPRGDAAVQYHERQDVRLGVIATPFE